MIDGLFDNQMSTQWLARFYLLINFAHLSHYFSCSSLILHLSREINFHVNFTIEFFSGSITKFLVFSFFWQKRPRLHASNSNEYWLKTEIIQGNNETDILRTWQVAMQQPASYVHAHQHILISVRPIVASNSLSWSWFHLDLLKVYCKGVF